MDRREMLSLLAISAAGAVAAGIGAAGPLGRASERRATRRGTMARATGRDQEIQKLDKPKAEWREILPSDAYRVLFEEATERPGTSPLNDEKRPGTYICAACFLPLFSSEAKYESGTGWPSFYQGLPGRLETKRDFSLLLPRTEYHCARCGGHQGHLFDDGPPPTGKRYCNNGVALRFVLEGKALPDPRT